MDVPHRPPPHPPRPTAPGTGASVAADRSVDSGVTTRRALDPEAAYRALVAHDARFDGTFFVGVTSTRIYCRPVCRVRVPMAKNCRFYPDAAQAEHAGFRPCRRCRPELAPGLSRVDTPRTLADHAAALLERAAREGTTWTMASLAARLGVTDRHLRRLFVQQHGVSPLDYATTHRLLFAKHLLTDTQLPIASVALQCGFQSVRRFQAAFGDRYRMTPTALRQDADSSSAQPPAFDTSPPIHVRLGYRAPYDGAGVFHFLAARALPAVEHVNPRCHALVRTLQISHGSRLLQGHVQVSVDAPRSLLHLRVSEALSPALGRLMARTRRAFDLDAEPDRVKQGLQSLPVNVPDGLRLIGSLDPWETTVRIVLGQQVTVAAARTLASRLVESFGGTLKPARPTLARQAARGTVLPQRLFPSADVLARASPDALGQLGIVRMRVQAIQALARTVLDGRLNLDDGDDIDAALDTLRALPGVGEWTAQLVALRVLGWPDAFTASDLGVLKALKAASSVSADKPAALLAAAQAWSPWRGYAVMALWQSLETGT
jgi:AraC family transcriptional regulator, regulatory protein of adaptative response / DNA-3-methyladenine glycosylase II